MVKPQIMGRKQDKNYFKRTQYWCFNWCFYCKWDISWLAERYAIHQCNSVKGMPAWSFRTGFQQLRKKEEIDPWLQIPNIFSTLWRITIIKKICFCTNSVRISWSTSRGGWKQAGAVAWLWNFTHFHLKAPLGWRDFFSENHNLKPLKKKNTHTHTHAFKGRSNAR